MPSYKLNVLTPQGQAYSGDAVHCRVPTEDGFVGVLANHAPYAASSPGGLFQVREPGGAEKEFKVGPGFFEVAHNSAVLMTQSFSL